MNSVRWLGVVMTFLVLIGCGDDNPSVSNLSDGGHVTIDGGTTADVNVTEPSTSSPTLSYQKSERFDEHGHIRGVYGVPYIPKQGN